MDDFTPEVHILYLKKCHTRGGETNSGSIKPGEGDGRRSSLPLFFILWYVIRFVYIFLLTKFLLVS